jgi:hypothetical protein
MNALAATAVANSGARSRRLADRINPILVKEVRQALRGRYFRVMFWLTLGVSTLAGLLVVASAAAGENVEEIGQPFFLVMFGCMSAAVHGFTPFSAYLSTSAEWDENTHDLLVLSNLGPRQIVLGKLLSALTQALLYYSTFGPFLVFAFLLNGIDLLSISVLLVCSFATCFGLSMIGIALACFPRIKAARGMLMALFGAALVMAWGGSMGAATGIASSPQDLRDPEGQIAVVSYLTFALVVGGLFGVIAAGRFAHEEENRSSGLRLLSLGFVLLAGAWGAWLHAQFGEEEIAWATQVGAATILLLLWLAFFTEPDTLGRRTQKHVTAKPWLALLSIPFLPGGGRGMLLFLVHFVCALLGGLLTLISGTKHNGASEVVGMVSVYYGYAFVFLGLPAGIASFFVRSERARWRARVVIFLLVPVAILGPALLGLLFDIDPWMELEHPLNPVWVMDKLAGSSDRFAVVLALMGLSIGSLITLAFNLRRMRLGALEVLAASRARRERERAHPANS